MKPRIVPIDTIGDCKKLSPLAGGENATFIFENSGVIYEVHQSEILKEMETGGTMFFELAGPREKIYHDPGDIACGIVTCGGLCPGLNDVIQALVMELYERYGVKKILGFRYGYLGLSKDAPESPLELNPDNVSYLHRVGGTLLGSSRGSREIEDMVNTLAANNVKILFTIGGDGTMKGARAIAEYIMERELGISVIAVPKTIDNDLSYVKRSFGFQTAVEEARAVIANAHVESEGAHNGIGLVKLMGRHSGFIAANASLANRDVNFCLIPELPFRLEGEGGLFDSIRKRLEHRGHAVIVVAEGAGQDLIREEPVAAKKDPSGNILFKNVGIFLKEKINEYFSGIGVKISLKYIDPSYIIRSVPANAMDSTYCLLLGQNAAHAGMAGKTNMMVGYWNHHYVHVPLKMATGRRNQVDPNSRLWKSVMEATLQPYTIFDKT